MEGNKASSPAPSPPTPSSPTPVARIIYYDEHFELGAMCPFCNHGEFESLQYSDYVEKKPMLWCGWCGARSVLDISLGDVEKLYDEVSVLSPEESKLVYRDVPLCFIERVSNMQLCRYTKKERPHLPQECVREFVEKIDCNTLWEKCPSHDYDGLHDDCKEKRCEVCNEMLKHEGVGFNVYGEGNVEGEDECEFRGGQKSELIDFGISMQCNSYDVEVPLVPYPNNFDLRHDGIYIYLQCVDSKGERFTTCYWGC